VLGRIRRLAAELPVAVGWRPLPISPPTELPDGTEYAALGIPFAGPPLEFDSRDALLALEFARDLGQSVMDRTLDGLFAGIFSHRLNAGDRDDLLTLCQKLGLDPVALEIALSDGRYDAELELAEREAARYGIEQVPTILAGRSKIVGAAPQDLLGRVVSQLRDTD
jgi:predicted DsbA family dithiol-disulfide isomerase